MTRPAIVVALLALALTTGGAHAAEPAELRRLFPSEADVFVERDGLSRLVLPPDVLAACREDLSDLRLFDREGREVAFLVDAGRPTTLDVVRRFEPIVVDARRSELRRESAPPLRREIFDLNTSGIERPAKSWVLEIATSRRELVARIGVEALADDGERIPLVVDGSVFRIRGTRSTEKLRVPLPPFDGPAVRVTLETEGTAWIEPGFWLESARELESGGRIAVPLDTVAIESDSGNTVVEIERPAGIVPDLLRIETATGTFDRRIEVFDDGPAVAGRSLGSGSVFRVEALVPVGELELVLAPARGDRLRVNIEDGDSPPLEELTFAAVIRQPALIFSVPAGRGDEPAATLRFGGGRAHRPRYDLSALLPRPGRIVEGSRAEAAAALYDDDTVRPASIGKPRANHGYDGAPALAFAMRPAAEIDRRVFSHVRTLRVPEAREGLSRLTLGPEDLAILREDLSDVRVADDASRQWPYLLDRHAATDLVSLEIAALERSDGSSRFVLHPPARPIRVERLVLDADESYFDRAFTLEGTAAAGERAILASGRLSRPIGDRRPVGVAVADTRVTSLALIVADGDDAPLTLRSARARVRLPRVYVTAPEGDYSLLLGAKDASAPRYELERVRDVVLAVDAAPIEAGGLEANTDFSIGARLRSGELLQSIMVWGTLIVAVVVLTWLTLRLARKEQPGG